VGVLLAEALSAEDVEARALLHQRNRDQVSQVLLRDVLSVDETKINFFLATFTRKLGEILANFLATPKLKLEIISITTICVNFYEKLGGIPPIF
jgi:hypothetical protein